MDIIGRQEGGLLADLQASPSFVDTIDALLEPVIAAVWGAIVLGERRGQVVIAGGAMWTRTA